MIEWTPALRTGLPLLDEHNKTIFRWLAELESAAAEDRTLFGVYALTRLKHCVREHFAAEEALMKSADYPELVRHRAEHALFRGKLAELQLNSIGREIPLDTVVALQDWLTNHICQADMSYVGYLQEK